MAYITNSLKKTNVKDINKKLKINFISNENTIILLVLIIAIIIGFVDYMFIIKFINIIEGIN